MVWRTIRSLLLQTGKCQISSAPCLRLLTAMSRYSRSFWREWKPEKYCIMSWASDTCFLWWDSGEHIRWPCPIQHRRQFWFKTDNTYMFSSSLGVVSPCRVLCTPFIYFICLFTQNTGWTLPVTQYFNFFWLPKRMHPILLSGSVCLSVCMSIHLASTSFPSTFFKNNS